MSRTHHTNKKRYASCACGVCTRRFYGDPRAIDAAIDIAERVHDESEPAWPVSEQNIDRTLDALWQHDGIKVHRIRLSQRHLTAFTLAHAPGPSGVHDFAMARSINIDVDEELPVNVVEFFDADDSKRAVLVLRQNQ